MFLRHAVLVAMIVASSLLASAQSGGETLPTASDSSSASASRPAIFSGPDAFVESVRVLHEWRGRSPLGQFGWVTRVAGDIDGDGALDIVTSAPTAAAGTHSVAGTVHVLSSRSGKELFTVSGDRPGLWLGHACEGAGDIDGDGTPDILIGAPSLNSQVPGEAWLVSGKTGSTIRRIVSPEAGDEFGYKVAGIGDMDGDGCPDVAIGAPRSDVGEAVDAGRVILYSGRTGKKLLDILGEIPDGHFGGAVDGSTVGGKTTIVVGASQESPRKNGRVHVFDIVDGDYESRFKIEPRRTSRGLGHYFVALMGDVDGDGVSDVYASDFIDVGLGKGEGRIVVHSGATGNLLLDRTGTFPGECFGTSISKAGDIDGDGAADLIVGAWQNASIAPAAGKVYAVSGKDGRELATFSSKQSGETLGFDSVGVGDVDGDGAIDFVMSGAWFSAEAQKLGRVFLVAGPRLGTSSRPSETK